MAVKQIEYSRFEQRSVIKFLEVDKRKQCEIYKWMYDAYGEECLSQKMFTNGLNIGLSPWALMKMTIYGEETYWLSGKEKVLGAAIS